MARLISCLLASAGWRSRRPGPVAALGRSTALEASGFPPAERSVVEGLPFLQQLFHHDGVHPLAVEQALLAVDAHRAEAELLIERDATRVGGEGGEDHLVIAMLLPQLDEPLQ